MTTKTNNQRVTDKREVHIVYQFPLFSRYKCKYIRINQRDLIAIYRQIKSDDLKTQIKLLIKAVDEDDEYKTDIDGQCLSKEKIIKNVDRTVERIDIDLRDKHVG